MYTYEWEIGVLVNGTFTAESTVTTATLALTDAHIGKWIRYTVAAKVAGYNDMTATQTTQKVGKSLSVIWKSGAGKFIADKVSGGTLSSENTVYTVTGIYTGEDSQTFATPDGATALQPNDDTTMFDSWRQGDSADGSKLEAAVAMKDVAAVGSVTYTARYVAKEISVILDPNYSGDELAELEAKSGVQDNRPDAPTSDPHSRNGWTLDGYYEKNGAGDDWGKLVLSKSNGTWSWSGDVVPSHMTSSCTIYAKWTKNTYTITVDHDGGVAPSTPADAVLIGEGGLKATYDDLFTLPGYAAAPVKSGYAFLGYFMSGNESDKPAIGSSLQLPGANDGVATKAEVQAWLLGNDLKLTARWQLQIVAGVSRAMTFGINTEDKTSTPLTLSIKSMTRAPLQVTEIKTLHGSETEGVFGDVGGTQIKLTPLVRGTEKNGVSLPLASGIVNANESLVNFQVGRFDGEIVGDNTNNPDQKSFATLPIKAELVIPSDVTVLDTNGEEKELSQIKWTVQVVDRQ